MKKVWRELVNAVWATSIYIHHGIPSTDKVNESGEAPL